MLENTVVGNNGYDTSRIIKVASASRSTAVAGAIAAIMREKENAVIQAIGAGAVNQAVKALAMVRQYLKDDGIDFFCVPQFIDLEVNGNERTAVRFSLESCPPRDYL